MCTTEKLAYATVMYTVQLTLSLLEKCYYTSLVFTALKHYQQGIKIPSYINIMYKTFYYSKIICII